MKSPSRKPSSGIATSTTVIFCIIAGINITFAHSSPAQTCSRYEPKWERKMFSPRQERDALKREEEVEELKSVDEYFKNCDIWPGGIPFEHLDKSCNRYAQNAKRRAAYLEAENASEEELIPSHVFLNLPEEKTWACPLDSGDESGNNDNEGHQELGMNTLWILHNEASTPIILSLVDENGFEVSAIDFHTFPYHGNTAVHPHGPVVLPGHMAAVEGRQGHLFLAREYNENGVFDPEELELFGSYSGTETDEASSTFSWKNYGVEETIRTVFPKTWSFAKKETRFVAKNDVMHVLGHPGRVLMKHRMGMIYVRNEGGALCQEGGVGEEDDEDFPTRHQNRYPECNVMTKGFINKVGCPIDVYFAPPRIDPTSIFNCERLSSHLGSLSDSNDNIDLDAYDSPIFQENTYNSHVFVARMSHDDSFVARIEFNHDVVRDCPDPSKSMNVGATTGAGSASREIEVEEVSLQNIFVDSAYNATLSNTTKSVLASNISCAYGNTFANAGMVPGGYCRKRDKGHSK